MDGVLTDSEPAFHAAVNDVLAAFGKSITIEEYEPFIGSSMANMWTGVIALKQVPVTYDEVVRLYDPPLMRRLREPRPPLPGARDLVEKLQARGVPVALCTASLTKWVDAILPGAGLDGLFAIRSTADMVAQTKPAPDPYLLAAEKLGLPAESCVAVEDSVSGLTSALRAGMHVIQLRATETAAHPMPGVAQIITSLDDFPLELVL
jgi:HAD superfamily hydrolase (TIGR01509 family)